MVTGLKQNKLENEYMTVRAADIAIRSHTKNYSMGMMEHPAAKEERKEIKCASSKKQRKTAANRSRFEFRQLSPRDNIRALSKDRGGLQGPSVGSFNRTASQHNLSSTVHNTSMRPAIQQRQPSTTNKKRKNLKRLSYPIQKDKN